MGKKVFVFRNSSVSNSRRHFGELRFGGKPSYCLEQAGFEKVDEAAG